MDIGRIDKKNFFKTIVYLTIRNKNRLSTITKLFKRKIKNKIQIN